MKEFIFTWIIENYSYCWHETEERLDSPVFVADALQGTKWTLRLYPRGHKEASSNSVSFYLMRNKDSEGPDNFAVNFYLSFLDSDGSTLKTKLSEFSFEKGGLRGFPLFMERNELLFLKKSIYLPQDTLTARCVIRIGTWDISEAGKCFARTRIGIERISFVQVVEQFKSLQPNEKATVQLKSTFVNLFTSPGLHGEENIIVEIEKFNCNARKLFSCDLFLVDAKGESMKCGPSGTCCDASGKDEWRFPLNYSKSMLLDKRSEYLPNDSLSVRCDCIFTTGLESERVEQIHYGIPRISTKSPNTGGCRSFSIRRREERPEVASIADDFRSLFEDQAFSDVKIETKAETFFAHKSVLCSRSPVFKAIFMTDMKEKASSCIQVEDLEDDTVRRLLLFLYSDTVDDLQWGIAEKLYYAADKYQVQRLKVMCSSFLMDNLSTCHAVDALVLADKHQDQNLKRVVENFILVRDKEVFTSETWKKLMKINPHLAVETMRLKYERN